MLKSVGGPLEGNVQVAGFRCMWSGGVRPPAGSGAGTLAVKHV